MEGEDPLTVAQELHLAEKEVTEALNAALAVKTEFYQGNAQSYQTLIISRLEEAYRDAKSFAYGVQTEDNPYPEPSIHWFRVMLGILADIQKLIAPHLDEKKGNTVNIFSPTILMGDDMHKRGSYLSEWKDKDITDLIEGQVIDNE